jgi:alpha-tubulin suppressor-like RCC1 family protein
VWGNNFAGQLGQGNTIARSSPVQVGALTTWAKISAFSAFGAITTSGTLFTWGYNANGSLGLGDVTPRSSPVQVGALTTWQDISMGNTSSGLIEVSQINPA